VILYQWKGAAPNFGDELNAILWPHLLPNFFDNNPDTHFLGIGSVLDGRHPADQLKLVAGAGYGGYEAKPMLDDTWLFHWVRGPRTAAALGLPRVLGLGDPAVLLPLALPNHGHPQGGTDIGFMPHFESIARGTWQQAAAAAGIILIDPRDNPLTVLDSIRRCKLLLSEALHGVIVADALRVPWVAVRPLAAINRAKWQDWSDTMDLTVRPQQRLPASSASEWVEARGILRLHTARVWLDRYGQRLDGIESPRLTARAAAALRRAMQAEPQLSTGVVLDRCQSRMMEAVTALRRQPLLNVAHRVSARAEKMRSGLRRQQDSAYHLRPTG
jgi:succinoglycan biosynthesis protein ExoV